jgi:hypothetical protein
MVGLVELLQVLLYLIMGEQVDPFSLLKVETVSPVQLVDLFDLLKEEPAGLFLFLSLHLAGQASQLDCLSIPHILTVVNLNHLLILRWTLLSLTTSCNSSLSKYCRAHPSLNYLELLPINHYY